MATKDTTDYAAITAAALALGASAGRAYHDQYGDRGTCGMAVVVVPARSKLASALKKNGTFQTGDTFRGGYWLSIDTGCGTQSIATYEATARTVVKAFEAAGINDTSMHSWVD